ncbi:MAG: 3-phosphoshikimate 1-carboxyvinyltransferase [Actinobacteria bacterium]|nr:3-phosphoshikimate 1-carboxyvinyltransferase [Actinomycetota bacterium]
MTRDVRAIEPLTEPPDAVVRVPGSKSLTNRALVCAGLAEGTSVLRGALRSEDTEAMMTSLARLGVPVSGSRDAVVVDGTGGRLPEVPLDLDARLSGTTARFLLPVLALGPGPYRLDGGEPLRRRPNGQIIAGLRELGVQIDEEGEPGHLPVVVRGGARVRGRELRLAADVSSQFASGLLLAAPYLPGGLRLRLQGDVVSRPYVTMTAAMMRSFGIRVQQPDERTYLVPAGRYRAVESYAIEPDASAASYFFAAAAISGGRVRIEGLGTSSLQGDTHVVDVLEQMGAEVARGEGFLEVRGTGVLHGIDVNLVDMPDMATTVAAVAVFADSPTTVRGVQVIRGHETDRLDAIARELTAAGIVVDEHDDGWTIHPGIPTPTTFTTYDDHRMAMSLSLLGLRVGGMKIADPGCVAKTFPGYFEVLDELRAH